MRAEGKGGLGTLRARLALNQLCGVSLSPRGGGLWNTSTGTTCHLVRGPCFWTSEKLGEVAPMEGPVSL